VAGILPTILSARPLASPGMTGVAAKISVAVRTSTLTLKVTPLDQLLPPLAKNSRCGRDSSGNPQCITNCPRGYVNCNGETFCCRTFLSTHPKGTCLNRVLSALGPQETCLRDLSGNPSCLGPCPTGYAQCSGETFCCRTFISSMGGDLG